MTKSKSATITIDVVTNENNIPEKITWNAPDGGIVNEEAKAMILSLWDAKASTAMRIDLWDKEMTVDEMKKFFHQTLLTMADSFERATGEKNICEDLRDFCHHFGDKMNILPPLN